MHSGKALKNCGLGHIPVISLNLSGLDSAPGFKLTLSMLKKAMYAIAAADLMMWVSNQCYPYEKYKGATDEVIEKLHQVGLELQPNPEGVELEEV